MTSFISILMFAGSARNTPSSFVLLGPSSSRRLRVSLARLGDAPLSLRSKTSPFVPSWGSKFLMLSRRGERVRRSEVEDAACQYQSRSGAVENAGDGVRASASKQRSSRPSRTPRESCAP